MADYAIPAAAPKPATSPPPSRYIIETVPPAEMGAALAADAAQATFGTIHLIIRGFLCTPFLAYGASMVFAMVAAGRTARRGRIYVPGRLSHSVIRCA